MLGRHETALWNLALLLLAAALGAGCATEHTRDATVGKAELQLREVPADVRCIRIQVRGSGPSTERLFEVTPGGENVTLTLSGLPLGELSFSGDAFASDCSAVQADSSADWSSAAVVARVESGAVTRIILVMKRNGGRSVVAVSFEDGAAGSGGADGSGDACLQALLDREQTRSIRTADPTQALDVEIGGPTCYRYMREPLVPEGRHEALRRGSRTVFDWTHTGQLSVGRSDLDGDGLPDRDIRIQRSSTGEITQVLLRLAPDGTTLERTTTTIDAQRLRVRVEARNSSGQLVLLSESLHDLERDAHGPEPTPMRRQFAQSISDVCSAAQREQLERRLAHAFAVGTECLTNYRATELIEIAAFRHSLGFVTFKCGHLEANFAARLDPTSAADPASDLIITVNLDLNVDRIDGPLSPVGFFSLTEYDQSAVLFHEILHSEFGGHRSGTRGFPGFDEFDRVKACENLCFGPRNVSKCTCATCLRTDKCDARCELLSDCDYGQLGFVCPCPRGPNAGKVFPTCSTCLAACSSGLDCAGFSTCIAMNSVQCASEPPPSCP